jgi:CheY-like chemotaxis protein
MDERILVIDDDDALRDVFTAFLTDEGWDVSTCAYANVNLWAVQALKPALIILDLNIKQAGIAWNFLKRLKLVAMLSTIPIVVCTTYTVLPDEIKSYLALQHISVVQKPFDLEPFLLLIADTLQASTRFELFTDPALPILVVEDNPLLKESLSEVLGLEGYRVVTAADGQLALDAVTHGQHSLILLDIATPILNCVEFLTAYAQRSGPHSPVLICSGVADKIIYTWPAFVIGVVPKPYDVNNLLSVVNHYAQPA